MHNRRLRSSSLTALLLLLTLAPRAWAAEGGDAAADLAQDHFERGQTYFVDRKFNAAAAEFRAGYEIRPAAAFIFNEAICQERLGDRAQAAALFGRYLAANPNARDRAAVQARIARLKSATVRPDPEPEGDGDGDRRPGKLQGVLVIESRPPGATIFLDSPDGEPLGRTPWQGTLDGKHKVIVSERGYKDQAVDIAAEPGTYKKLVVVMSQAHFLGWLEVRSNIPGSSVYVDDRAGGVLGHTPFMGNILPGKHTVIVTRDGYTESRQVVEVTAGEASSVDATLERAPFGFIRVGGANLEGARVKVDGQVVCQSTPCRIRTPVGEHTLKVEKSGQKTMSRRIAIGAATESEVSVKLVPRPSRAPAIWKLVFAGALIGGGTYMTVESNRIAGMGDDGSGDATKRDFIRYAGIGLLAGGGALAIAGVVGLVSDSGPPSVSLLESRDLGVSVAPVVAPGYAGLVTTITFGR